MNNKKLNNPNLNTLVNKTKSIKPYNNHIITSENYVKTNTLIADDGMVMYGNSQNIIVKADSVVNPGGLGPILQFYGKGDKNSSVGINLDTFEGSRYIDHNPATQILAVDNGQYSSDLIFKTAPTSFDKANLPVSVERVRIQANGDVIIKNNVTIDKNLTVNTIYDTEIISQNTITDYLTSNVLSTFNGRGITASSINTDNLYATNVTANYLTSTCLAIFTGMGITASSINTGNLYATGITATGIYT